MTETLTASLAEFAAIEGVPSQVTLRQLIKDNPDFPAKPGTNGVAYEIDVAAAIAWLKARDERRVAAEREHAEAVKQLGLELLGDNAAANVGQTDLAPSERKALLEEEFFAIKVAEKRGELVRRESIDAALTSLILLDAKRRATFMTRLDRAVDFGARQREILAAGEALMEDDRRLLVEEIQGLRNSGYAASAKDPGS